MNDHNHINMVMHPVQAGKEKKIPEVGFLFVNPAEASYAVNKVVGEGRTRRFLFNSTLCVNGDGAFFVAGPAVGAPMAVLSMEKLIVLRARKIILVGWCGALRRDLRAGDVLLPGQALCGEGTSRYYSQNSEPEPSESTLTRLRAMLRQAGIPWREGRVWSTNAPYRESRDLPSTLI